MDQLQELIEYFKRLRRAMTDGAHNGAGPAITRVSVRVGGPFACRVSLNEEQMDEIVSALKVAQIVALSERFRAPNDEELARAKVRARDLGLI